MRLALAILIAVISLSANATTYYIDFTGGADANNGTATGTPWKHHPYMAGWTGSYVHSSGDRFIFKGGVVWDHTCFPLSISNGGSSGTHDYYGVDQAYFTGGSWARPQFDAQVNFLTFVSMGADNVDLDNIEMLHLFWSGAVSFATGNHVLVGTRNGININNCYFHAWTHGGTTEQNVYCILGSTSVTPGVNNVISNCVFTGYPSGTDSMAAVYCMPVIKNCIATNLSNGFIFGGGTNCEVSSNTIGPINTSFDAANHENSIESEGFIGSASIHHNVVFAPTAACFLLGDAGTNFVIYDNIITNTGSVIPIVIDSSISTSKVSTNYIYNNTVVVSSAGACIRNERGQNTLFVQNNHLIGGDIYTVGFAPVALTMDHNVTNANIAAAVALGYTYANQFQPSSSGAPTVNTGTGITSTSPNFSNDLIGVTRPQGSAWDIGAYEFLGTGNTYYVATNGSTANNGLTSGAPWPMYYALTNAGPSNILVFLPGTYTNIDLGSQRQQGLTLRSQTKWAAKVTGASGLHNIATESSQVLSNVVVDGFEVIGSYIDGIKFTGPFCTASNNWVHFCTNGVSDQGIAAHNVNGTIIYRNLIEWNGTDIQHDHGIYAAGTNVQVVGNVLRYNKHYGLQMFDDTGDCMNCLIANNLIYSNGLGMTLWSYAGYTNIITGNTILSSTNSAVVINGGNPWITNNILQCGGSYFPIDTNGTMGSTAKVDYNFTSKAANPQGPHDTVSSTPGYLSAATGLYWLTVGAAAIGVEKSTVFAAIDFFGNAQASVAAVGAVQYNAVLAADTRTLDPSPAAGADYWTLAPPDITINTQPQNQTVSVSATATFTVSASNGGSTLHYQWIFNGSNVGSDSSSYARANCQIVDSGGVVQVLITDSNGSLLSSTATLTVLNSGGTTTGATVSFGPNTRISVGPNVQWKQ